MTGRVRAGLLLAALLAAGCAEEAADLAPFPCADDGTCPESLTCAIGMEYGTEGTCRLTCASSDECEPGSQCGLASGGGVCMAECTPFGTDCEPGTVCRLHPLLDRDGFVATCTAVKRAEREPFGACQVGRDCAANASCVSRSPGDPPTCRPNCDADHPCRRGTTCEPLMPSGAGVCR